MKVAAAIVLLAGMPVLGLDYATQAGGIRLVTLARDLAHPWGLAFLPDGRMLVTERPGRLRFVSKDGCVSKPIPGVPEVYARGQGGLLDVITDTDFAQNSLIYLSYAEPGPGGAGTAVMRARLTDAGLEDGRVIFRQVPKVGGSNHFGSRLVMKDGYLFITLGERYQRERAQDLSNHLGKIVRINPDGSIPLDNPFFSRAEALPEIWSYGHRNSQGAAIHPKTGELWIHEHGAQGGDEVNIPEPGKNYGWPVITHGIDYSGAPIGEGTAKTGMEQPLYHWSPSIAPSGMAFYSGDRFPAWQGNLFVGSLAKTHLARLTLKGRRVLNEERLLEQERERIRDVRAGPDGLLYLLTDSPHGRLLRIEPS